MQLQFWAFGALLLAATACCVQGKDEVFISPNGFFKTDESSEQAAMVKAIVGEPDDLTTCPFKDNDTSEFMTVIRLGSTYLHGRKVAVYHMWLDMKNNNGRMDTIAVVGNVTCGLFVTGIIIPSNSTITSPTVMFNVDLGLFMRSRASEDWYTNQRQVKITYGLGLSQGGLAWATCPVSPLMLDCTSTSPGPVVCTTNLGTRYTCASVTTKPVLVTYQGSSVRREADSGHLTGPHQAVTGTYVTVPDIRSETGKRVMYIEEASTIYTESNTLIVSHINDKITLVKSFKPPEAPIPGVQLPPSSVSYLKNAVGAVLSRLQDYVGGGAKPGLLGGVFGKLGCMIDSITPLGLLTGGCSSGSGKQAAKDAAAAIKATNDAVHSVEGQVSAIVKSEAVLKGLADNNRAHAAANTAAVKALSSHTDNAIAQLTNTSSERFRLMMGLVTTGQQVAQYHSSVNEYMMQVEEYKQLTRTASGSYPTTDTILKMFSGHLYLASKQIDSTSCIVASVISQGGAEVGEIDFVLTLMCMQPDQSFSIYLPSPIVMSHDGLRYLGPAPLIKTTALLAADSRLSECTDPVLTPGSSYTPGQHELLQHGSEGMCITHRLLSVDMSSLQSCNFKFSESTITCFPYQIHPVPPQFIKEGAQFPWKKQEVAYMAKEPTRPYFPYVAINSQLALLVVPAAVYAPPVLNNQLPAGTIFSFGSKPGKVSPLSSIYTGTRYASVSLPTSVNPTAPTYEYNTTYLYSTHYETATGERLVARVTNQTNSYIDRLFDHNKAFQGALDNFTKGVSHKYDNLSSELDGYKVEIHRLSGEVDDSLGQSNALADKLASEGEDAASWMVWLALALSGVDAGFIFILFIMVKGASAVELEEALTASEAVGGAAGVIEVAMPYIITTFLGFALFTTLAFLIRVCLCSTRAKGLRMVYNVMMILCFTSMLLHYLNQAVPISGMTDLFSASFLLIFAFLTHGLTLVVITAMAQCIQPAAAFKLIEEVVPSADIRNIVTATVAPIICPEDVSTQRWIFMGFTVVLALLLAVAIMGAVLQSLHGVPLNWRCSRWQRIKMVFTKLHPLAIRVEVTENRVGVMDCDRELQERMYLVGWVDEVGLVRQVSVPDVCCKGNRTIISSLGVSKSVDIHWFPEPGVFTSPPEQKVFSFKDGCLSFAEAEVQVTKGLSVRASRRAIKEVHKSDRNTELVAQLNVEGKVVQLPSKPSDEPRISRNNAPSRSELYDASGNMVMSNTVFNRLKTYARQMEVPIASTLGEFVRNPAVARDTLAALELAVV